MSNNTNYVQMTLQDYNDLILENARLKDAIKVREDYLGHELLVTINTDAIKEHILPKAALFAGEYKISKASEWYEMSMAIGRKRVEEVEAVDE